MERLIGLNPVTAASARKVTMTFPGGSLTGSRDLLGMIFDVSLLPDTCSPAETIVSRKQYVRTRFVGDAPSNIIETDDYVMKAYGSGDASRAAGGEAIRFQINGDWWTARLTGTHQAFMDYLCDNSESLRGDATYWISAHGRKYYVAHSQQNQGG